MQHRMNSRYSVANARPWPWSIAVHQRTILHGLTVVIFLGLVVNLGLIFWGSFRGFDFWDEGYYWLSYTYKDYEQGPMNIHLGSHLLFLKLVSFFNLDVVSLRWARLLGSLSAHAFFAWAVVRWISRHYPSLSALPAIRPFGFALITASLTMTYWWAPQTPSYNDLATFFGLIVAALGIEAFAPLNENRGNSCSRQFGLTIGAGFALGWMAFIKWPAGLATAVLLSVATAFRFASQGRAFVVSLLGFLSGFLLSLAILHLWVIDLRDYVKMLVETTVLMGPFTHPKDKIFRAYLADCGTIIVFASAYAWWWLILLGFRIQAVYRSLDFSRRVQPWLFFMGLIGLGVGLCTIIFEKLNLNPNYVERMFLAHLVLVVWIWLGWSVCFVYGRLLGHWRQKEDRPKVLSARTVPANRQYKWVNTFTSLGFNKYFALVLLLFGLPLTVACGTGNSLLINGTRTGAGWAALFFIGFCASWSYRATRSFSLALVVLFLFAQEVCFYKGYLRHPYNLSAGLPEQSESVPILPRGSGLLFDPVTADFLHQLALKYQAANPNADQPIMAFYDMAGVVYLLGGKSLAIPWYFNFAEGVSRSVPIALSRFYQTPTRTASAIRPFILVSKEPDPETLRVLHDIGVDYPAGYKCVGTVHHSRKLLHASLWLPK